MVTKPVVKFAPQLTFASYSTIIVDSKLWGAIAQDINLEFYVSIKKTNPPIWKIIKGGFKTEEEAKHWVKTLIIPLTALHGG